MLTKYGKNNKREQKDQKKTKIMIFFVLFRGHIFDQIQRKNVDSERVLKKNKKEQKRQRTSWVFPGGMIFFDVVSLDRVRHLISGVDHPVRLVCWPLLHATLSPDPITSPHIMSDEHNLSLCISQVQD